MSDGLEELLFGAGEVLLLVGEKGKSVFELLEFGDGV